MLVIGEMGNGKSTTMNQLIAELNTMFERENTDDQQYFDAE